MEEALISMLLADSGLAAIVGSRLNWDVIPQGSADPAGVLYLISGVTDYHMAGPSGLVDARVQLDFRAPTKAQVLAADRAAEAVLSGYRGTVAGIKFQGIFRARESSDFEKTDAQIFYRASADYLITHGLAA